MPCRRVRPLRVKATMHAAPPPQTGMGHFRMHLFMLPGSAPAAPPAPPRQGEQHSHTQADQYDGGTALPKALGGRDFVGIWRRRSQAQQAQQR